MIREITGDVFLQDADIVCHQVNCRGVMGAGIAKTVREKISPKDFEAYREACRQKGAKLLGSVQFCRTPDCLIANCFAQDGYGRNGLYTDYKALTRCMGAVRDMALGPEVTPRDSLPVIAVPKYIGCGLAGGDWGIVFWKILVPMFGKRQDMKLVIAEFPRKGRR